MQRLVLSAIPSSLWKSLSRMRNLWWLLPMVWLVIQFCPFCQNCMAFFDLCQDKQNIWIWKHEQTWHSFLWHPALQCSASLRGDSAQSKFGTATAKILWMLVNSRVWTYPDERILSKSSCYDRWASGRDVTTSQPHLVLMILHFGISKCCW